MSPPSRLPRLPYRGPAWLSSAKVAAAGLAWVPLALGALFLAVDRRWAVAPGIVLVIALVAVAAEAALARWMARAATRLEAVVVALGAQALIAGTCAFVLTLAGVVPPDELLGRGPLPATFTALHASCVGSLAGLWQGVLGAFVAGRRSPSSHDLRDRLVVGLGLRIAGPAAVVLAAGAAWGRPALGAALFWVTAALVLPLLAAAGAHFNGRARRRWACAVAQGRVPGWRIVDDPARATGTVLPLEAVPPARAGSRRARVLVRTQPARDPFRDAETMEPVALVPDPAHHEHAGVE